MTIHPLLGFLVFLLAPCFHAPGRIASAAFSEPCLTRDTDETGANSTTTASSDIAQRVCSPSRTWQGSNAETYKCDVAVDDEDVCVYDIAVTTNDEIFAGIVQNDTPSAEAPRVIIPNWSSVEPGIWSEDLGDFWCLDCSDPIVVTVEDILQYIIDLLAIMAPQFTLCLIFTYLHHGKCTDDPRRMLKIYKREMFRRKAKRKWAKVRLARLQTSCSSDLNAERILSTVWKKWQLKCTISHENANIASLRDRISRLQREKNNANARTPPTIGQPVTHRASAGSTMPNLDVSGLLRYTLFRLLL